MSELIDVTGPRRLTLRRTIAGAGLALGLAVGISTPVAAQTYPSPPAPEIPQPPEVGGGTETPPPVQPEVGGGTETPPPVQPEVGGTTETPPPVQPEVGGTTETPPPVQPVVGGRNEVAGPSTPRTEVRGVSQTRSGSLPVTGGDVVGLAAIGAVLLTGGAAAVSASRRRITT